MNSREEEKNKIEFLRFNVFFVVRMCHGRISRMKKKFSSSMALSPNLYQKSNKCSQFSDAKEMTAL